MESNKSIILLAMAVLLIFSANCMANPTTMSDNSDSGNSATTDEDESHGGLLGFFNDLFGLDSDSHHRDNHYQEEANLSASSIFNGCGNNDGNDFGSGYPYGSYDDDFDQPCIPSDDPQPIISTIPAPGAILLSSVGIAIVGILRKRTSF